ncbi:DEAD-box ATP-dependent RNA helicase 31 [Cocos nucifera]|uniref:ATP-dependent RNA helicase n=1 Tax=Cocos nucifera TaxID=13894 RepID=A0A8K0IU10_COCNU|nr:DEAD-box ATP-dependent RNA helicase 31 [Cocos nucifera]
MPGGELLAFRSLDSRGILRSPGCPSVLGRAFPFKLKYQVFSSKPRLLLFPRRWRRDLCVASTGSSGKFLFEDEAVLGDRISDRKTGNLDPNRIIIKKNGRDISPLVRNGASLKRQRDGGSDGFQGFDDRRKLRHFLSKKRFDEELDEEEGKDHCFSAKQRSQGGRAASERRSALNVSGEEENRDDDEDITKARGRSSVGENESHLSQTRFEQCSISLLSLKGVKAAGYERMTLVQEATLPLILEGKDVLAKAKTGTGKTLAFLLPAIEVISKLPLGDHDKKRPSINVLVVCPTRELASQAAAEAKKLLKFHPSIGVQVVIGGTRLTLEQKCMQANPCQILVATPGRLKDHIQNTPGFATRLMGVKVLVLDEADQLLDMGFRKDIEKIVAAVPKQRQTLLFSATVPDEVRQICHIAMRRDYELINTVEEGTEETHSQVRQTYLVAPLDKHFQILYSILTKHISEDADYKVIVFCTTAMVTKLVADLLSKLHLNIREIHSRKQQNYRTRVSEEFRQSKGLILVSSDVSARGVDYPDVTLVMQASCCSFVVPAIWH